MELTQLKTIWQAYDSKLEKTLKLNLHCLEQIQTQKIKSQLAPLYRMRIVESAFHSIALLLLLVFFYNNFFELRYAVSAAVLIGFYGVALSGSLRQIGIIKRMDYSSDIVSIQSSLVMLQTHSVNAMRLIYLCLFTFLAYPVVVSEAIADLGLNAYAFLDFQSAFETNDWWTAQVAATMVLIPLGIWLYREVSYKNIHKPWVRRTIELSVGKRVLKAMDFWREMDDLKKENS